MSKVLITGAGGYVGGRLVGAFHDAGWDVGAVVREREPRLTIQQTVCEIDGAPAGLLAAAAEGAGTVVHLAGEDEVLAAREPARALAATVVATERIAEACVAAGVRRLVYMSTVHVYGTRIAPGATPGATSAAAVSRVPSMTEGGRTTVLISEVVGLCERVSILRKRLGTSRSEARPVMYSAALKRPLVSRAKAVRQVAGVW